MRQLQLQPRWPIFSTLLILAACSAPPPDIREETITYPSPPDPPRIQFLRSLSSGSQIEPGRSGLDSILFGKQPENIKPIHKPTAIAFHRGIFYVCDGQLSGIYSIDIKGRKLDILRPRGRGSIQKPTGIFIDPGKEASLESSKTGKAEPGREGAIFISDARRRQVLVYDLDWNLLKEMGPWAKKSGLQGLQATEDRIYVADSEGACVRVVDRKTGKQLYLLGESDDRATGLRGPTSLSLDKEGNVFVVDTIRSRIQVWNKDGEFLRTIGGGGDAPGFFARPKALKVSGRTIWVIDSGFANCQILDLNGRPLMFFADGGTGPGQLYLPRAIWIGEEGLDLFKDYIEKDFVAEKLIIIASQYGPRKLNFYAFGKSKKFDYPSTPLPERPTKAPMTDTETEDK